MSVDVKTPTRTQFEHPEFQCRDRGRGGHILENVITSNVTTVNVGGIALHSQDAGTSISTGYDDGAHHQTSKFHRKRKLSERGGSTYQLGQRKKSYRKTGDKIVLPSKFLLGGNITDPLNLNALCHDEIGKALNEATPQSSPMPVPAYKVQEIQVLIPPNINDPLNLNVVEEADGGLISPKFGSKKKKHKHKKKRPSIGVGDKSEGDVTLEQSTTQEKSPTHESSRPVSLDLSSTKDSTGDEHKDSLGEQVSKILDKIVSPVIPQLTQKSKKVKRLSSECLKVEPEQSSSRDVEKTEINKVTPQKPKRQISQQSTKDLAKSEKVPNRYIYGNYNRYYGYRNPGSEHDNRLSSFRADWFKGKDILDIGCNIGHVTLSIARDFSPRRILGMDIDGKLIGIAKKNIRHYMTNEATDTSKFPQSLPLTYGPIAPPPVPTTKDASGFPYNVMFAQGNYVPKTDEELDLAQEEYDTILALSLTKWIHLNWGDDGIKRMFKRMYRQLKPGGKLILEPQPWSSYKKKKKISETIFKNFQQIKFRPEQFTEYLLSKDVGFVACEHLETPFNRSEGFQRPLQVFMKAESGTTPVEGVTPLMEINCTPGTTPLINITTPFKESSRGATPRFDGGSSGITPCSSCQNTPTYMCNTWSASCTPKNDSDTGDWGTPGRHEHDNSRSGTSFSTQHDSLDTMTTNNG